MRHRYLSDRIRRHRTGICRARDRWVATLHHDHGGPVASMTIQTIQHAPGTGASS
jgi:hypothetical protein